MLTVHQSDLSFSAEQDQLDAVEELLKSFPDDEMGLYAWYDDTGEGLLEEDTDNTFVGSIHDIMSVWDEDSKDLWCRAFLYLCGGDISKLADILKAEYYEVEILPDSQI